MTLHWIDEGIDTGEIVAQRSFKLQPGTTQHKVLIKTAIIGARLVKRCCAQLSQGSRPASLSNDQNTSQYYAFPSEHDVEVYKKRHRFFRIRDMIGFFIK